jgi:hypothetical protein
MPSNYVCLQYFLTVGLVKLILFDIGRKAAFSIKAVNRMASLAHMEHDSGKAQMREAISKYKEESARVCWLFLLRFSTRLIVLSDFL